jgi:GNAT superfamily N-acetyltransferase
VTTQVGITIREASAADLPAILDLHGQLESDGKPTLSVDDARKIYDRMQAYPRYTLYVATEDRAIIGTFALLIMDNLAHGGAPSGIVEDVVVSPACQGKGVGKQMMQFAMDRCREAGCYKLALSSHLKRTQAHQFYESLGFEHHGYSYQVVLA